MGLKTIKIFIIIFFLPAFLFAQDSDAPAAPKHWGIGLRIVNGHSTYTIPKGKLDFYIQHRFGYMDQGTKNFFGLDESNIRLGFEYGLFQSVTVGVSRSNMGKMFSGYAKWNLVKQGKENPVSATVFSDMDISGEHKDPALVPFYPSHRYRYTHQLIVSRVFGKQRFMIQAAPTIVHRNLVDSFQEPNDLALLAMAFRYRINRTVSLTGEYSYLINHNMRTNLIGCLGAGIELYTSGHVFQLVFTNAAALTESQYMTANNGSILGRQIRFGFNIVRRF